MTTRNQSALNAQAAAMLTETQLKVRRILVMVDDRITDWEDSAELLPESRYWHEQDRIKSAKAALTSVRQMILMAPQAAALLAEMIGYAETAGKGDETPAWRGMITSAKTILGIPQ